MSTKTLIVTGAAAWLGGIATSMAALSCDVEQCDTDKQPSAIVRFWAPDGSTQIPIQATSVQYQIHAEGGDPARDLATAPSALDTGRCLDAGCTQWTLGQDEPGRVVVHAEACGQQFTAEAVVEMDDLGCHTQTEYIDIEVDPRHCPIDPQVALPPYECEPLAHPSVHVMVAKRYDDYFASVDVDMVWFEHEGKTHEARCLEGDDGCLAWIAGYELAGPITVSTEYCDTVVTKTVEVSPKPDSCHVQTEFLMLEVSTLGCVTGETQEVEPPPPEEPWDLTAVQEVDRPDAGPTDLRMPHPSPPPPPPGQLK